jgi:hypothetical protein
MGRMSAVTPIADKMLRCRDCPLSPQLGHRAGSIDHLVGNSMTWLGLLVSDGLRETDLEVEPSHAEVRVWCRVTLKGVW